MFDLLITNGYMVSSDGSLSVSDLGIKHEKVVAVCSKLTSEADQIVNAEGCIILPGVIDLHTHLRSSSDEPKLFAGETASAVKGGVTMLGDFSYPLGTRFELDFASKSERLKQEAMCDFCIHNVIRSFEDLEQAKSRTVKIFFSTSGLGAQNMNAIELLRSAVEKGHQVLVHVERMEDYMEILYEGIQHNSNGRVHILHVPHQRYVSAVSAAGKRRVTMETCPHYLIWEWTINRDGCDVNPSVEPCDLWPEIKAGNITTIGTDHCSYTWQEKKTLGLPGFPGVEELLRLMVTFGVQAGRISWVDLIRVLSAGPAHVLGLYPKKGALDVGSDADLVIFDPNYEKIMVSPVFGRGDFSPYKGLRLYGKVVSTFVRGRNVYMEGSVDPEAIGWGRWQDQWCTQ